MVQQTVKVTGRIEKTAQQSGKKYIQYQTSSGNINLFDEPKINAMDECVGSYATMDIVQRGNYLNVTNVPRKATMDEANSVDNGAVFTGNNGVNQMPSPEPVTAQAAITTTTATGSDTMTQLNTVIQEIVHKIVDDSPKNWVEVGKAGERMKIYFHDQSDLHDKLKATMLTVRTITAGLNTDSTLEAE